MTKQEAWDVINWSRKCQEVRTIYGPTNPRKTVPDQIDPDDIYRLQLMAMRKAWAVISETQETI